MKTIIVNASPRKNWNTAQLLKEAQKGAESVGAETEYIELYDLTFTGCRSCLACKRKNVQEPCRCYWKDDLTPLLEQIWQADRLILGSPVYYSEPLCASFNSCAVFQFFLGLAFTIIVFISFS